MEKEIVGYSDHDGKSTIFYCRRCVERHSECLGKIAPDHDPLEFIPIYLGDADGKFCAKCNKDLSSVNWTKEDVKNMHLDLIDAVIKRYEKLQKEKAAKLKHAVQ